MKIMFKCIVVLSGLLIGCGTILHGPKQDISVSAPSGGTVNIDGNKVTGDTVLKLDRKNDYTVTITKNGENHICAQITSVPFIPIVTFDALLIIPAAIDYYTGAWYNLEPTNIRCN